MVDSVEDLMRNAPDVDALYELLADSSGLGADEIDKAAAGKTLFARVWSQQKQTVCANVIVQRYMRDPNTSDATAIAAQVLGLLIVIPGINMAVVACLAVRIGLRTLCSELPKP